MKTYFGPCWPGRSCRSGPHIAAGFTAWPGPNDPGGGLWRWDGFVAGHGPEQGQGQAAAQVLIERRQRLADLEAQLPALMRAVEDGEDKSTQAHKALETAQAALKAQDQNLEERRKIRDKMGAQIAEAQQTLARHRAQMAAQEAERAGTLREQETVSAELQGLNGALKTQGDLTDLETAVTNAQAALSAQSQIVKTAREGLEAQKRDLIGIDARLGAILTEAFTFEGQLRNSERQFDVLAKRGKSLESEALAQSHRPKKLPISDLTCKRPNKLRSVSVPGRAMPWQRQNRPCAKIAAAMPLRRRPMATHVKNGRHVQQSNQPPKTV